VQVSAGAETRNTGLGNEAQGNVKVHGLWKRGSNCVLDVRITDRDAKLYQKQASKKVLERAAKVKKNKYLKT